MIRASRLGTLTIMSTVLVTAGCAGASRHPRPRTAIRARPGVSVGVQGAAVRALQREARPIGRGRRFEAPARGPVPGRCRSQLGARLAVHIEIFARNRVVLIPAGIGVAGPVREREGQIVSARCFGELATLDPTGVALVRPGTALTLGTLFRAWGEPLSATRLAGFSPGRSRHVRVFIDGRRRHEAPGAVRLTEHAEIVLEVGPSVPPHRAFTFAPVPAS